MFPIITKSTWAASKPSPLCTFLVLIILTTFTFYTLHFPNRSLPNPHELFLSAAANSTIAAYLRDLTAHPHLAGTEPSLDTTRYVETHFRTLGLDTHTVPYKALLSYPLVAAVSMRFGNGTTLQLPLNDEGFSSYSASGLVRPYHAYAPSGSAQANVVFVNYGREEDYRALAEIGVEVSGCIVLARRGGGGLSRGAIVEIAEGKGAVGVLMYSEGKKGVERGTVMRGIGDPLTPGWPSTEDEERLGLKETEFLNRFPKIASLPLPCATAQAILGSLGGPLVPHQWRNSDHTRAARVGPGPFMVNFTYQGENRMATINNVFAVIRGSEEPDRYVLLGNHRDAWTYGAVDPNSGTATLLDIARRYALLMQKGWQPRRTLILCSWDAEEFGMDTLVYFPLNNFQRDPLRNYLTVGSTEWVEQNVQNLGAKAVAYLNVDCAVQGPGLFVGATPQLDNLISQVTRKVQDPDSEGATLDHKRETSSGEGATNIQRLSGVDSDFAPFLQHAGVPSVDIYYGRDFPVYHTAFDSFSWMISHADPFFQRHVAVAGIWGLLGLRLADDPVLSFDYVSYADQLWKYKDVLSNLLNASMPLTPLIRSIQELSSAAKDAENEAKELMKQGTTGNLAAMKIRALNDRLMLTERSFLDADGLKGSPWFKHLIYGPERKHERSLGFFPGVGDAISGSETRRNAGGGIEHEMWRVGRAIRRAADALRGQLY